MKFFKSGGNVLPELLQDVALNEGSQREGVSRREFLAMATTDRVNLLFVFGHCYLVPGATIVRRYDNRSGRVDWCSMAAEPFDDDCNCNGAAPVVASLANAG